MKIPKKILIIYIITILLIIINTIVFADDENEEDLNEIELQELAVESVADPLNDPVVNARAAVIYDRTTNQVLWGKNENDKRAMASTTKIMTALVVIENCNLSDIVIVSSKAAGTGGSRLKINKGDKISVKDLLYGLMLRSRE